MTTSSEQSPLAMPTHAPAGYGFPKEAQVLLPWSHALARLEAAQVYWLATVRPDGCPHVTPLWGAWVAGAWYFDGVPQTRWARNLQRNHHAAIHLESGEDVVIVEGIVEDIMHVEDADLATAIIASWDAKYGRLHPDPASNGILRLHPVAARAWSRADLHDGTRWQFAPRV
jgi:general stress protein 26